MRPVIGVTALIDYQKESYWMLPGYFKGLEMQGALPIMLPLIGDRHDVAHLLTKVDAVLFTGGQDVGPFMYGEDESEQLGETSLERDTLETILLQEALERDMPILGICRGIQLMNAALGGTLYQDIPTQLPSDIVHDQKAPYDAPSHSVKIVNGTLLHDIIGKDEIMVNSLHHQGVKRLSPHMEKMAVAPDGLIEAANIKGQKFALSVQWHPEFSYKTDNDAKKIFKAFVNCI